MPALDDFQKTLKSVAAVQRRPQPRLTNAEITQIIDQVKPFFDAYEAQIAELESAIPQDGPTWYGFANDGSEYTGDQKKEVLHQWMQDNGVPEENSLLRATLGERAAGPRARGPVTFYTFPSPNGIAAIWIARSDNLALLKGMVSATVSGEEETEE